MTQHLLDFGTEVKLSRQQRLIVELFESQGGRATNVEMVNICLRYTSRIFELRKKGFDIEIVEKRPHGVRLYEMTRRHDGEIQTQ